MSHKAFNPSIYSLHSCCRKNAPSLLNLLSRGGFDKYEVALKADFGRFRVWAENVGAHRRNHESLDYRLSEAPKAKRMVLKLLEGLGSGLQKGKTHCVHIIQKLNVE